MAEKLFLVTREDLPWGQQAVQAAHAMREFVREHPEIDRRWYETSNTLALLVVRDERALERLIEQAQWKGVPFAGFREPDRQNELTAVALGPSGGRLCQRLSLAFAHGATQASQNQPSLPESA